MADHRVAQPGLLEPRTGTQEVRLVRDLGFPAQSLQVFVDGALVADLWEREALALWLMPGGHSVSCVLRQRPDKHVPRLPGQDWTRSAEAGLDLRPGSRPCIRLSIVNGRPVVRVAVSPD